MLAAMITAALRPDPLSSLEPDLDLLSCGLSAHDGGFVGELVPGLLFCGGDPPGWVDGPGPGANVVPVKMAPQLGHRVAVGLTLALHREQRYSKWPPPRPPPTPEKP